MQNPGIKEKKSARWCFGSQAISTSARDARQGNKKPKNKMGVKEREIMNVLTLLDSPWAILPEKLLEIQAVYGAHLRGEQIDIAGVEAKLGKQLNNSKSLGYTIINGVAVIPIEGVISKRMNLFSQISGGVSTQMLQSDFAAALADPMAHSILLLIDSPGGSIDGLQQAADDIRAGRGVKPVYAFADGLMASAAYWIGSAAEKVFSASDTTAVGSIGVIAKHVDYSKAQEKDGVKVTDVYAGKYKALGSKNAPLSNEGRAMIQAQVDHAYSVFVDAVAKNRGVSAQTVLDKMADGRVFFGKQAVDAGLVDGISSMADIISQLTQRQASVEAIAAGNQAVAAVIASEITQSSEKHAAKPDQPAATNPVTATEISNYVAKQASLGRKVSYSQAAAHIARRDATNNPGAMADRISDYVAEQRKMGNRVSFAEAAAHIESNEKRG